MVRPASAQNRHGTRTTRSGESSERPSSRRGCSTKLSSHSSSSSIHSSSSTSARSTSRDISLWTSDQQRTTRFTGLPPKTIDSNAAHSQRREGRMELQQDRTCTPLCSPNAWRDDVSEKCKEEVHAGYTDCFSRPFSRDVPRHSSISSRARTHGLHSSSGSAGLRKPHIRTHSPAQRKIRKPLQTPRPRGNDTTCAGQTA